MTDDEQKRQEEQADVSVWRNIGKTIFLIAALVAAWFLLDWLMGGK
jgi:hypothetical protein